MIRDRQIIAKDLKKIQQKAKGEGADKKILQQLASLEKRLEASIRKKSIRVSNKPRCTFPENLPISTKKDEIIKAIRKNQVTIISGDTGCGKSTQIPKMCLEAGRGIEGKIGCTQPRRVAATTIARRVAEELGEKIGKSLGYKIRFKDRTPRDAYIKIMTDGMLLAETQQDPYLNEYDTLIIDEAHERSLNIDLVLGILKTLLAKRRHLKLIITSATIDTEKFSRAFDAAPVIEVKGRMYPVDVEYMPMDPGLEEAGEVSYVDMAIKAVEMLQKKRRFGDVLIFMPTERDILETCEVLEGRRMSGLTILPLFARLTGAQQAKVFSSMPGRKIVVATNVAETSLTIPGIKYVIDTGLARISRYSPRSRTAGLPISPVSQSSADQRKGRCGRVEHGICIRLYSEEDYESRPAFTSPEILRSNLADVILRMISLNLGHIESFPFIDRPNPRSIKDGFDQLLELGAIVRKNKGFSLTEKGRIMARMPIDPRISRMMIEAGKEACVKEVTIIASALSIRDPGERPLEKGTQADRMHAPFKDPDSDFITLLRLWNFYHDAWKALKTQNKMRKFCKQHFLSFVRMREWIQIHEQITGIMDEQALKEAAKRAQRPSGPIYARIHRAILSGYLSNIALKKDKNIYQAAKGRETMIFPGSTLFNKGAQWIVAAEMIKTSRLFARTVARIQCEWLEDLGRDLCSHSYSSPHWEKKRAEVMAMEQVSLYGLIIVSQRPVSYGPIDPEECKKIFIRSALIEGDVRQDFSFLRHNRNLVENLSTLEDKVRRRDVLVSEGVLADFYYENLDDVHDIPSLNQLIKQRGSDDFLKMKERNLILSLPDKAELKQYPDQIALNQGSFKCLYKFAPGEQDDGVTIKVPNTLVSRIHTEHLEWLVPGLFKEKVTAMLKGLPKRFRKQLVPVSRTVDVIIEEMEKKDEPLITMISRFVYRRFGVDIPPAEWQAIEIPDYLKMRVSITDHKGLELVSGRDIHLLREHMASILPPEKPLNLWKDAQKKWERSGITQWDFGQMPTSIPLDADLWAYPALEPGERCVNIHLFDNMEQALETHKQGIMTLFSLHFAKNLKLLKRFMVLPEQAGLGAEYFGGARFIEKALHKCIINTLFCLDIRTEEAFLSHAKAIGPSIPARGKELMNHTALVLDSYYKVRSILYNIESTNKSNMTASALCEKIRKDQDYLVPRNFLELYNIDRLIHIPRYLKAMGIRAERGVMDYEKDQSKSEQVAVFISALDKMKKDLSPHASREKREAMEAYRWMIEEFKVSLFAQELKTPFPISKKRVGEKKREIERMI
ncbi:MAG: ATP-dependent RNA helicase HrpA [Desulfobacterales bacterium]|nr:ATP-dependent RNA helicase HrpA [Desulfobacterales bacterium]